MERSIGVGSSGSNSNSIYQKQGILGDGNATFSAYRGPFREKDGHATAGDDSTEISIFEAQKYFNESIIDPQKVSSNGNNSAISTRTESPPVNNVVIDNMEQLSRSSWASSSVHNEYSSLKMGSNNYRARSFHAAATPTASSEASWNSQTGLLSHRPGTIAVSLRSPAHHHQHHDQKKKKSGMATSSSSSSPRLRWFSFPRRCPCSGKKSVRVEEKVPSQQQQPVHASSPHYSAVAAVSPNSKTNAVRSISLDLRNQTSKSVSVISNGTANLNSSVAESDQQHALWDQDRRRRWDGQGSVKMPTRNVLLTAVPAAAAAAAVPQMQGQQNANGFSFPILKANGRGTPSAMFKLQPQTVLKTSAEKQGLGSASHEGHSSQFSATTISIHKPITDHLSSLAGFTFAASPPKPRVIICNDDDLGSDASSDLFEIESLSTSTQTTATGNNNNNYPSMLYCRRDSMEDDAPSFNAIRGLYRRRSSVDIETMTASDCYEPSEASIDWSVTTAEGLDRPSISSEAEEFELEKMNRRRPSAAGNYGMLSCRWVSVGPNPVPRVASSSLAVNVGDEVLKHVHVGSRPPLPNKPRSSHLSIPYAT